MDILNLNTAKEITLLKNEDGTYSLFAKFDVVDKSKKITEMECNCEKVAVKNMNIELLSKENLMTLTENI